MEQILSFVGGVDALVAMALPLVLSFVMQRRWSWQFKANVAWVACLIVSIGIAAAQGLLAGLDLASAQAIGTKFGVILTIASQTYDKFWKPTQIGPKVEAMSDLPVAAPAPPVPAKPNLPQIPSIEEYLRQRVQEELAKRDQVAPTSPIIAGVPIAPDADFSDVDETGVEFPAESAPDAVAALEPEPLLGTIDWGAAKPITKPAQEA